MWNSQKSKFLKPRRLIQLPRKLSRDHFSGPILLNLSQHLMETLSHLAPRIPLSWTSRFAPTLPAACCQVTSVTSDSVQPHRWQPTRLPCPWDSPGKNTGVGCHFLLQCMKVKSEREVAQSCPTLSDPMDYSPPGSSVHGIFQARVLE